MNEFSRTLIERSGYQDEAFADVYDRSRPAPPPALLEILAFIAQVERPRLVVDLGAGTGLSTRAWAERADRVIGVEANEHMVERARRATAQPNVGYVNAYAAETGLADGGADVVGCSQAFHWMEPGPVLAEAARLLRPGGVFAAYDYDVPPLIHPEVDAAFEAHFEARRSARERLGLEPGAIRWPKSGHLERIRESGRFRFAREVLCHGFAEANSDRIAGLAESLGGPRGIFADAGREVDATFADLRRTAERVIGNSPTTILVSYRIRFGVK